MTRPKADLHAAVVSYLTTRSWPFEDHGEVVVTPVVADSDTWTAFFDIRDEDQMLIVYSIVPVAVPVERRTDVALYIARANWGLAIGNFEIDLDVGEVRFRTSADLDGTETGDPTIDHLLLANVVAVETYIEGLRSVVDGDDPRAAIVAAEHAAASGAGWATGG